jgi:hypothetical protein
VKRSSTSHNIVAIPEDTRIALEPFIAVFETVILAGIAARGWAATRGVRKVAAAIETAISSGLGHPLHPVIVCFALRICCNVHITSLESAGASREWDRRKRALDGAQQLIVKLEEHYGVYELKLLAY